MAKKSNKKTGNFYSNGVSIQMDLTDETRKLDPESNEFDAFINMLIESIYKDNEKTASSKKDALKLIRTLALTTLAVDDFDPSFFKRLKKVCKTMGMRKMEKLLGIEQASRAGWSRLSYKGKNYTAYHVPQILSPDSKPEILPTVSEKPVDGIVDEETSETDTPKRTYADIDYTKSYEIAKQGGGFHVCVPVITTEMEHDFIMTFLDIYTNYSEESDRTENMKNRYDDAAKFLRDIFMIMGSDQNDFDYLSLLRYQRFPKPEEYSEGENVYQNMRYASLKEDGTLSTGYRKFNSLWEEKIMKFLQGVGIGLDGYIAFINTLTDDVHFFEKIIVSHVC